MVVEEEFQTKATNVKRARRSDACVPSSVCLHASTGMSTVLATAAAMAAAAIKRPFAERVLACSSCFHISRS